MRDNPERLAAFLRAFPKGADLHNHLSGAIYAESYIGWAIDDGACIDKAKLALAPAPCTGALVPAAAARDDKALYAALVRSLSMQDFQPDGETGHDHFFATFNKFGAAPNREGDMLAETMTRAAADHTVYLELMTSPGMTEARALAKRLGDKGDFVDAYKRMMADKNGIDTIVAAVGKEMDAREKRARELLHCGEPVRRAPACDVTVRYLAQIIRVFPPPQVFAEDVLAFRLAENDPRFVGLNIVGPEDDLISLHDYTQHMRMFAFLHALDGAVKMSLHAGELAKGQRGGLARVKPADLRFHIRQAVQLAHASRIGHGVDIMDEELPLSLLTEMAAKRVLVEINLTSNAQILGIEGEAHPFLAYRRAGVPTALSTDDPGVERIDLTHEYVRAAQTYRLSYAELKALSRNALEYAFAPGKSLWQDATAFAPAAPCAGDKPGQPRPSAECADFLAASEKARLQWRLEADFADFEANE